jgi:pseudouridylate synthase
MSSPPTSRLHPGTVAIETTLLLHGVPKGQGKPLADELSKIIRSNRGTPAIVGVIHGQPIVGLTDAQLEILLAAENVPKANTANLGALLHSKQHAATTVATTMELASGAGVRVFATGGLGGVHRNFASHLDISADLAAFTRFPVAVVTSGVKSLLDVAATRELLETLGVPVVGFQTSDFPAFYLRSLGPQGPRVDARFDDVASLASFVDAEMRRTGRGVVVCNPIPVGDELQRHEFERWLAAALEEAKATNVSAREVTPFVLGALHRLSGNATLRANLALVRSNAALAAQVAAALPL